MVEKIAQHTHCWSCGRAIKVDEKFCNQDCESKYKERLRKKKNQYYLLIFMAMAILFFSMFSGM